MNFFSIMYHELRCSWLCVLPGYTSYYDRLFWAWWFYDTFALIVKLDFIFPDRLKKYFIEFNDEHVRRVQHNRQHGRVFFYYLNIPQVIFSISWFDVCWRWVVGFECIERLYLKVWSNQCIVYSWHKSLVTIIFWRWW